MKILGMKGEGAIMFFLMVLAMMILAMEELVVGFPLIM